MVSLESFLIKQALSVDELKGKIYSYREQEKIVNQWLKKRLDVILPKVMKRSGIDLWVVACREYNEDPVFLSLVPASMMSARRTSILVFHQLEDGSVKKMALTRPGVGLDDFYEAVWVNQKGSIWQDGNSNNVGETQFECLARIIQEANPEKIGLNISEGFAFGDGLSKYLYDVLVSHLAEADQKKIVSAEKLAIGWLETRLEEELAAYNGIVQIAHTLIAEAFSSKVILPGVTTNHDVKYFMLQKTIDLGLTPWFDYEVSILRAGNKQIQAEAIIMPGDILHCDVGFKYLGLCTDTQENAYVLKADETDAPDDLKRILTDLNRLQDITISNFKAGLSGNEILAASLKQAISEGIKPSIYTHPIGYHGHGAGPTIGLWDQQGGVKLMGEYLLYNDTLHSLELNVSLYLESWNQNITLGAETDLSFSNDQVHYCAGRQEKFHLIK